MKKIISVIFILITHFNSFSQKIISQGDADILFEILKNENMEMSQFIAPIGNYPVFEKGTTVVELSNKNSPAIKKKGMNWYIDSLDKELRINWDFICVSKSGGYLFINKNEIKKDKKNVTVSIIRFFPQIKIANNKYNWIIGNEILTFNQKDSSYKIKGDYYFNYSEKLYTLNNAQEGYNFKLISNSVLDIIYTTAKKRLN